MTGARAALAALGALGALVLALPACSRPAPYVSLAPSAPPETTTSNSATTLAAPATATTAVPTTTATTAVTVPPATVAPPPPPPGLGPGDRGPAVLALEQRLDALRYDVGTVDDAFDRVTSYAVTAFQKVHGTERTGRATDDVLAAVSEAKGSPPPLVPGGNATRVEVDIARQVLFLYEGGRLSRILPVSTGSGERFCSEGWCRRAVTPGGAFGVYRFGRGWEYGPLGALYNPLYFSGGVAIHGAPSVPASPASHGCVRIPMNAAEWFPTRVGVGTAVYVLGGPGAESIPAPELAPPPASPPATLSPPPPTLPPLLGFLSPPTTRR